MVATILYPESVLLVRSDLGMRGTSTMTPPLISLRPNPEGALPVRRLGPHHPVAITPEQAPAPKRRKMAATAAALLADGSVAPRELESEAISPSTYVYVCRPTLLNDVAVQSSSTSSQFLFALTVLLAPPCLLSCVQVG